MLFSTGLALAQSFAPTRFPPQGSQYVESTPMTQNWLYSGANTFTGDYTGANVVFFEIPDTTTQTLYFAIRNPDVDAVNGTGTNDPDRTITNGPPWVDYTLIGGTGAYSAVAGQHLTYLTANNGGTVLDARTGGSYTGVFAVGNWVYFNGVSPSQGEHIGNKYYFRLTAVTPGWNTSGTGIEFKHAYQFDVSLTNSGSPTGLSNGYAFGYDITFAQLLTVETWNFYPFVPYGAGSPMTATSGAFNYANTNAITIDSWTDNLGVSQLPFNMFTDLQTSSTPTVSSAQTNATWHLQLHSNGLLARPSGAAELYFPIGGSLLRIYTTPYSGAKPDHFTLSPATSTGKTGGNLAYRAQLVDASGNPILYIAKVQVSTTGSATINGLASPQILTTDTTGGVNFTVSDAVQETTTLSLLSNGTGGTISLPGVNGTATATFVTNPLPTLSSASNVTFVAGSAANQPVITISANGGTQLGLNGIKIQIPASLSANFSATPPNVVLTTGTGTLGAPTVSGNVVTIPITVALSSNAVVTVGSVTPISYTTTNSPSSGSLQLSVDGGTTYPVADDKVVTIQPTSYTWNGSASTAWNNGANWTPNIAGGPQTTANVRISTAPLYPVVTATTGNGGGSTVTVNDLIIDSGASVTLNGATAITASGAFSNSGTFTLVGNETVNLSNSTATGTVVYAGSGTYTGLAMGTSYYNLTFSSGTYNLNAGITVNGNLTLGGGTLNAGSQTVNLYGNWTNSGGAFTASTSTVNLAGTGTAAITGTNTFYTFACTAPGKTLNFANGVTQTATYFTITGAASQNVNVTTVSGIAPNWTLNCAIANVNVNYASLSYSTETPGTAIANSSTLTSTTGWSVPTFTTWTGGAGTTSWNTAGNWNNGIPNAAKAAVIVPATFQPTLDISPTVLGLSIAANATLTMAGLSLTLNSSGTIAVQGTLKMNGGEALTNVTAVTGAGTVNMVGGGSYTVQSSAITYNNLTINGTGSFTTNGALNVSGDLIVSAGSLTVGANAVSVGGNLNLTGSAGFSGTGTVTMSPAAAVTLRSGGRTLPNLVIGGSGSVTLGDTAALSGGLTINSGSTLSAGNQSLSLAGSFGNSGTFTAGSGTVTFTSSAAQSIAGASSTTFNNLTISTSGAGSVQLGIGATVSTALSVSGGGVFDLAGYFLTFGGSASLTNAGTIKLKGSETITGQPAGAVGGTVVYYGIGANNGFTGLKAGTSYTNLSFATSGGFTSTWNLNAALTVTGTLSISSSDTLDLAGFNLSGPVTTFTNAGTLRLQGAETVSIPAAAIGGTVNYYGTAGPYASLTAGLSYTNLVLSAASATTRSLQAGTLSVTGTLTIGANETFNVGGDNFAIVTLTSTGILALDGSQATQTISSGSSASGIIRYKGAAGGTVRLSSFYNLDFNSSGATFTLNGSIAAIGALSVTAGILVDAGYTINVGGDWTVAAASTYTATGTVTLNGTGAQTITSGGIDASHAFNNLTINKTSGTATLGAAILVNGNLTLTAGALDVSAASNYAITVNGNWSDTGTFTAQTGTVTFGGSGPSAISGTTSFYNLTCTSAGKTLQFAAGSTQTIASGGKLTITGTAGPGNLISLVSSSSGTQWNLVNNSAVASSVANAFIQDSNLSVNSITANTSRNNGNNSALWLFSASTVSWSTTPVSTLWTNGANWASGYVPNPTDSVIIPAGASQWPDLGTAGGPTVAGFTVAASAQVGNSAADTLTVTGNLVFAGTMNTPANSTILMTGTGATINGSASIGNLTVNPGVGNTISLLTNPLTISGNLALSTGTFATGALGLSVGGNISRTSGVLTSGATLTLNGAAAQVVDFTGATLTNLTVNNTYGTTPQITASSSITLSGNLVLTSGTMAMAANSLAVAGNISQAGGAVSFTGAGLLTLNGSLAAQSVDLSTIALRNLTVNNTSATAPQIALAGSVSVGAAFTHSAGTIDLAGHNLSVTGSSSLGPTIQNSGAGANLGFTGAVTLAADTSLSSGGGTIGFGSTVDASSAGGQSLSLAAVAGNISFTGAVGTTRLNLLSISSANNLQFSSTVAANSLSQTAGSGTTTLSGNVTTNAAGGVSITTAAVSLGAVTIDSSAGPGPITLNAPVTLTGNASLTSGTNTAGGNISATSIDGNALGRTLSVMSGTGGFSVGAVGTLNPLGATLITANALSFSGGASSVKLNGATLTLRPATANTTIGVGGGTGTLNLTAADLAAVASTCSGIIIGRAAGTAAVTVNAVTVACPLSILAGGAGGTVAVNGQITATGATGVTISSGTSTTLAADIRTNGGMIDLSGAGTNIIIGAASVTLATASGGSSNAAAITLGTNPVSASAAAYSFNLDASTTFAGGSGGNVTIAAFNTTPGSAIQNLTVKTKGNGGTNGSLTAPGAYSLIIPGTTTIDIGTSSVTTLTNAANDFGTVAITSAANVTFNDANAVTLGPSTLTGALTLSAAGAITESGVVSANILAVTNTTAATNLGTQNNVISHFGPISASGRTVSLFNTAISDQTGGGAITAAGLELLGTGSFTLTNAANAITTLAGNVTAAISYTNNGALSIGTVNTAGLTSTGAITLVSAGTIGQSQIISAPSLSVTSVGGSTLAAANTVSAFSATNSGGGAIQLLNTAGTLTLNGVSQVASGAITVANTGNMTSAAAIASSGGIVTLTASGAGSLFTNNSSIASSGAALNIFADDMALSGGTINGGAGLVTLSTVTVGRTIDIGTDTPGDLGLTSAELNTVTSAGGLTIGDTAHTGLVQISAACNPLGAGSVAIVNQTGGIAIGANFTANTSLTLTANGGGALVGAISRSAGTIAATAGSLTLNAATGIGVVGTAAPIVIGAVGGTLSADNTQSGDLYLQTTAAAAVTLGGTGYSLIEANSGILRVDASGGALVIGGNLTVGGTGSIALNANGSITRTAGTLSAPTILLGQTSATAVGASGAPIFTAATTSLAAKSSAGDVWLSNTGNVNANAQATGGVVNMVNAGTFTTNGAITSAASTVTISSSGTVNLGNNVSGKTGVTIGITAANTPLNQTAGTISTTDSLIALTADNMSLGGTTNSGTGNVVILPLTPGTLINLGGADAAGTLGLTSAELGTISAGVPGVLRIGNGLSGTVTVSAAVSPGSANVHVTSGGGISGVGTITATNLALSAGAAINVSTSVSTIAATTTAGGVTIGDVNAAGVAIGTVDGVAGIASGNTAIAVTETAGSLTVNQAVNAGTNTANLTGVGITNNSTVTGGSGITIAAGAGTFTNSLLATLTNGGGAALVSITADDMDLLGTITAGSGQVNLTTANMLQPIYIGTGTLALGLSSAELNTIATTGTLTIGDAAHTGNILTDGALTLTGPTGPVALLTRGGNITLNNAVTTAGNLSANTTGSAATGGDVTGTGQLIIGAGGANSLTVTTSNGINLNNPANQANAVNLTNGSVAGNIVFYNNRNMSLTASNASAGGTISVVNGTGNMTIAGAVGTTGPGAANITLQTPGSLTISNSVTSGGSGFISLSAGTTTQAAIITSATSGLVLLGAGPYTLNGANVVGTIAANVTGAGNAVIFTSVGALTVSTVNGTNGITTNGGNLTLTTTSGGLTVSQPISTGAGTVTLNPTTNISLSYATAVISTTNAAVNLQRPVLLGANSVIVSGTATTSFSSTIDDSAANTDYLHVSGNASFGGVVGTTPIASLLVTGTTSVVPGATSITTGTTQEYDGAVTLGVDTNFQGGAGQLIWFKSTLGGGGAAHAATITTSPVQFDGAVGGAANLVSTLAVNSGTTSLNANVTTTGTQTYGGAVTLGVNVNFSGTAGNLVWFKSTLGGGATARTVTVTTAPVQFDGAVGGAANLVSSLSVSSGVTALNANVTTNGAQTYGGAVTLGASVSTISGTGAITFNSTVGQSGTWILTIQNAGSTGTVTFTGAVTLQGLVTGAGAYAVAIDAGGTIANAIAFTNTGGLTIVAGLTASSGLTASTAGVNTFSGTVQNDGAGGHNINVSNLTVGANGLTLNVGLSNFVFTGTVSVGNVVTAVVPDPVDDPTDMTITAALIDGSVSGTLQLATGATVDIGSSNFNLKTLVNPGVDVLTNPVTKTYTRNVGIIRLTGLQTTHTIATAGYSTASGAFLYYGAGGTIFTTGLVDTSAAPGPYNYWDLIINGTGTFTPEANLAVHGSIRLRSGVLDGSAALISVGSNWRNDVGAAAFVAGSNLLMGVQFLALTYPIYIWGNNTWFMFICTAPGATILYENDKLQQIATGGIFRVNSSGAAITLSRLNPGTLPPLLPDSSGNPSNPPLAADDTLFWFFDLTPGATFDMNNVNVYYSNARSDPVSVPAGVTATPYSTHFCFKWLDIAYSIYSYTEDSDYNGKIDRIRVTTESNLDPALTDFSGFTVAVQGYDIDTSKGTNGYSVPAAGKTYYIYLKEKPYNDTNVTPLWHIVSNTTFRDTGGKFIGTLSEAGGSDWMTPGDTAWPLIGYTLAIPGQSTAFVHLSEPVVTSGGGTPAATDFGFSGGLVPVTTSGLGIQEATGTALTAPTTSNIADGSNQLTLTGTLQDMGSPPHWEVAYNNQVIAAPAPTYPSSIYTNTPDLYPSYGPLPNPGPISRPAFQVSGGAGLTTHRVSDVLISVPMVATTDPTYFVWPIYAKDQVQLSLTDAEIAALSPAQTAAEGIGLIRAFDGSQWLRADDITLQARLQGALAGITGINLWFDSNVPASLQSGGLWLPSFAETGFSGLVPYPNASPWNRGASQSVGSSIGSGLWNFTIPKSDPRIVSISTLGFFFTLTPPGAGQPLYAARLDIPAGTAIPSNWYRIVKPFQFEIHDVRLQVGGVSILNNVIDPTKGETARLSYQLPSGGAVTVTVFTLDGDVVKRLVLATQAAGDYAVDWDGKNMGGRPVARGIYFIRVVAPGIDEIRKVLVVRH